MSKEEWNSKMLTNNNGAKRTDDAKLNFLANSPSTLGKEENPFRLGQMWPIISELMVTVAQHTAERIDLVHC